MTDATSVESPPERADHSIPNGNGSKYLSADQVESNAAKDIVEADVEAFGGFLRVRSLSAAQQARINQAGVRQMGPGRNPQITIADSEIMKFELGVIVPKFEHNAVVRLYQQSGTSFAKVLEKIDEISVPQDEGRDAEAAFPGSEQA